MRIFLFILSVGAFLAALAFLAVARGAIHEIGAFVLLLIAAVLLSGAAIVEAVTASRDPAQPGAPAYFYAAASGAAGPHSLAAMRGLRRSGVLTAETLVLQQGDETWQPARDHFPDLFPGE